jgi:hypothetical protein
MIIENKIAFFVVLPYSESSGIPNKVLIMIRESHMKTLKTIVASIKTNKFGNVSVGIDPDIYLISADGSVYSDESVGFTNLVIAGDSATMVIYSKNIVGSKIEITI